MFIMAKKISKVDTIEHKWVDEDTCLGVKYKDGEFTDNIILNTDSIVEVRHETTVQYKDENEKFYLMPMVYVKIKGEERPYELISTIDDMEYVLSFEDIELHDTKLWNVSTKAIAKAKAVKRENLDWRKGI